MKATPQCKHLSTKRQTLFSGHNTQHSLFLVVVIFFHLVICDLDSAWFCFRNISQGRQRHFPGQMQIHTLFLWLLKMGPRNDQLHTFHLFYLSARSTFYLFTTDCGFSNTVKILQLNLSSWTNNLLESFIKWLISPSCSSALQPTYYPLFMSHFFHNHDPARKYLLHVLPMTLPSKASSFSL